MNQYPIQRIGSEKGGDLPAGEAGKWLSMAEAALHTPYSSEYLSLLARKGKLSAKKINDVWYTTKEILEDYMKRQMLRTQVQNGDYKSVENSLPATPASPAPNVQTAPTVVIKKIRSYQDDIDDHKRIVEAEEAKALKEQTKIEERPHIKEIEHTLEKVIDRKLFERSRIERLDSAKSKLREIFASKTLAALAVVSIIFFTLSPIPFVFSFVEKSIDAVREVLNDANTVMGFRPGTHANELLLLDKEGNIAITGHIESHVEDGTAPIVVDSKTLVKNLNAEYLSGASSSDFTLAFVTKNGAVTTEDVTLSGKVEVGETLLVRGAAKLLSSLAVDGSVKILGNAEFNKILRVLGPAYFEATVQMMSNLEVEGSISVGGSVVISRGLEADVGYFNKLGVGGDFSASGETTLGEATSTSFFADRLRATLGTIATLVTDDISVGALTATNSTTTNATTTSLFSSRLTTDDLTADNLIFTLATGTSATTTNLFSTTASSTNLFSTSANIGTLSLGALTSSLNLSGTGASITFSGSGNHDITATDGTLRLGANTVIGNILPLDDSIDIGAAGQRFDKIYANEVNATTLVGTLTGGNLTAETFRINSDNATSDAEDSFLEFERGTPVTNALLEWDSATDRFIFNSDLFVNSGIGNGTLLVNGSTTLQNFTFVNATGSQATTTNFFSTTGRFTNLLADTIDFTNLTFTLATGTSATTTNLYSANLTVDDSTLFIDSANDRVGIGTTTPAVPLHVIGSIQSERTNLRGLFVAKRNGTTNIGDQIGTFEVNGVDNGGTTFQAASIDSRAVDLTVGSPNADLVFRTNGGSGLVDRMTISDAGNVGIGTTTPAYKLEVTSGGTGGISIRNTDTSISTDTSIGKLVFTGNDTLDAGVDAIGAQIVAKGDTAWGSLTNDHPTRLEFYTESDGSGDGLTDPRMVIKSDGKIGIGTTSPWGRLAVESSDQSANPLAAFRSTDDQLHAGQPVFRIENSGDTAVNSSSHILLDLLYSGDASIDSSATFIAFKDSNSTLGRIEGSADDLLVSAESGDIILSPLANVGISETAPDAKLEISNAAADTAMLQLSRTDLTKGLRFTNYNGTNSSFQLQTSNNLSTWTNLMSFDPTNSRVGVGTTTPYAKLGVSGFSSGAGLVVDALSGFTGNLLDLKLASSTVFSINQSGNLLLSGSTTLQNFTFVNATGTSATTTNLFSTTASSTNLSFTSGTGGTLTLSGLGTFSNILTLGSTTLQNFTASNSTSTNATSTNFFTTTASTTNFFFTTATGGNLALTGTATIPNLLLSGSTTLQNFTFVNATGTSATTTNLFSTTASSTNLFSSLLTVGGTGLVVDSSRNVGIGTTNPDTVFRVEMGSGINETNESGTNKKVHATFRGTAPTGTADHPTLRIIPDSTVGTVGRYSGELFFTRRGEDTFSDYGSGIRGYVNSASDARHNGLALFTSNQDDPNEDRLVITHEGLVGIGTTTPDAALDVYGSISGDYAVKITNPADNDGRGLLISAGGGTLDDSPLFAVEVQGGDTRFLVQEDGNVGIGTTSPSRKLTVADSASGGPIIRLDNLSSSVTTGTNFGSIEFYANDASANGTGIAGSIDLLAVDAGVQSALIFSTRRNTAADAVERMRIGHTGLVGIGTTTSASLLSVAGGVAIGTNYGAAAPTNGLIVEGNVGIGDTSPDTKLEIIDTTAQLRLTHTDGVDDTTFAVDTNGDLTINVNATGGAGNLLLSDADTFALGGVAAGLGYHAIADSGGATSHSLASDDDLYIEGDLEVDGSFWADGLSTFANLLLSGSTTLQNFTFVNATGTSATTTNLFSTTASSTNLFSSLLTVGGTGLVVDSSRNVGIGLASSIDAKLHIFRGNAVIEAAAGGVQSLIFDEAGTQKMGIRFAADSTNNPLQIYDFENSLAYLSVGQDGFVGIGTSTPESRLNINDGSLVLSDADVGHGMTTINRTNTFAHFSPVSGTAGGLEIFGLSDTDANAMRIAGIIGSSDPTDTTPAIILEGRKANGTATQNVGSSETVLQIKNGTTNLATILGSGNFGIGTTNPNFALEVNGQASTTILSIPTSAANATPTRWIGASNQQSLYFDATSGTVLNSQGSMLFSIDSNANDTTRKFIFQTNQDRYSGTDTGAGTALMVIQEDGNVGVGTTSPWGKLSVTNTGSGPSFVVEDTTSPDSTPFIVDASGNVGVGTSTPRSPLEVSRDGLTLTTTSGSMLALQGSGDKFISFHEDAQFRAALGYSEADNTFRIYRIGDATTPALTMDTSGEFGIGTTTPAALLNIDSSTADAALLQLSRASVPKGLRFTNYNGTNSSFQLQTSNNLSTWSNLMSFDPTNSRVGIGDISPDALLDVYQESATTNAVVDLFRIETDSSGTVAAGFGTGLQLCHERVSGGTDCIELESINTASSEAEFAINIDGTRDFYIDSSGRIGIGDTTPSQLLDVDGTNPQLLTEESTTEFLRLGVGETSETSVIGWDDADSLRLGVYSSPTDTTISDLMTILSSGNVGIGTTTPSKKLEIFSATNPTLRLDAGVGSVADLEIFFESDGGPRAKILSDRSTNGGADGYLALFTTNTSGTNVERLRIDHNGLVGIGSTTPYATLSVTNTGTGPSFVVEDTTSPDTTPFIVDASGNVGIGSTTPFSKLSIDVGTEDDTPAFVIRSTSSHSSADAFMAFQGNGGSHGYVLGLDSTTDDFRIARSANNIDTAANVYFTIDTQTSGNVGIGTTTPSSKLHVEGNSAKITVHGGNSGGAPSIDLVRSGQQTWTLAHLSNSFGIQDSGFGSTPFRIEDDAPTNTLRLNTDGEVGIGTATTGGPLGTSKLTVEGTGSTANIVASTTDVTTSTFAALRLYTDSSQLFVNTNSSARTSVRYGLTLGGWSEVTAFNNLGTSNGLVVGTNTAVPLVFGTSDTERLRITAAGFVGIGNTSPTAPLDITTAAATQYATTTILAKDIADSSFMLATMRGETSAGANDIVSRVGLIFGNTSIQNASINFHRGAGSTGGFLSFATSNGNERMRIDTSGLVGIGTTTPTSLLQIADTTAPKITISDTNASANQKHWFLESDTGAFSIGTTSDALVTNTSYRALTITSSGNVGIGTRTPGHKLHVSGGSNSGNIRLDYGGAIVWGDNGGSFTDGVLKMNSDGSLQIRSGTGGTLFVNGGNNEVARITDGGNLGLATTSPWRTLSVDGTVGFSSSLTTGSSGDYLCINTSTYQVTRGNGSACSTSSGRYKENIENLTYGLEQVLALRPVSFNFKSETNLGPATHLGFIAEEVQGVIPEVVNIGEDGLPSGIDYPVLTSLLARAIQELNDKVESIASSIGATVVDGVTHFVQLVVENITAYALTVGKSDKPAGITIYDEEDGDPYCVKVKGGEMVTEEGECGSTSLTTGGEEEEEPETTFTPIEIIEPEEEPEATSTPETTEPEPEPQATSTPPVEPEPEPEGSPEPEPEPAPTEEEPAAEPDTVEEPATDSESVPEPAPEE